MIRLYVQLIVIFCYPISLLFNLNESDDVSNSGARDTWRRGTLASNSTMSGGISGSMSTTQIGVTGGAAGRVSCVHTSLGSKMLQKTYSQGMSQQYAPIAPTPAAPTPSSAGAGAAGARVRFSSASLRPIADASSLRHPAVVDGAAEAASSSQPLMPPPPPPPLQAASAGGAAAIAAGLDQISISAAEHAAAPPSSYHRADDGAQIFSTG